MGDLDVHVSHIAGGLIELPAGIVCPILLTWHENLFCALQHSSALPGLVAVR